MTTHVDDFLKIGATHLICQDYVLSGKGPVPHVILSDGCSASPRTDVGARILAHLASQWLFTGCDDPAGADPRQAGAWIIENALHAARRLGLARTALDATLMIGWRIRDHVHIRIFGDGFVGWMDAAGARSVREIRYSKNAPYYLSYGADAERDQLYRDSGIEKYFGDRPMSPYSPISLTFPVRNFPLIFMASDGLGSFAEKTGDRISPEEIFRRFTAFKTVNGAFLKRRIRRAVRNLEKDGASHYDDLSAGVFLTAAPHEERGDAP